MNGNLLIVFGVQIVLIYGQPIFTPMAGHVGLTPMAITMDTLGAATGYSAGGGLPLLSPLELNAIMEAQSRGGGSFKSAFTPDTEPQGFSGFSGMAGGGGGAPNSFAMPNFEEGFGSEGNSEFYEPPHHNEPFPANEADVHEPKERPEPKGRDNRGPYHKEGESDGASAEGGHHDGPHEASHENRGREGESSGRGHPRQRGGYRDEEREPEQGYNEPSAGAYREHRGEGGPSEGADGPDGIEGPGGPEGYSGGSGGDSYRDDGPPEHFREHSAAFQDDRDFGGPGEPGSAYEPKSEEPSGPSGKQGNSDRYGSGGRRPVMSNDAPGGGYSPAVYQDDGLQGGNPSAYRPQPNAGYFAGRNGASAPFVPSGHPTASGARANKPDYSGYKVITG